MVLTFRSTNVLNFAQGEISTLMAFVCAQIAVDYGTSDTPIISSEETIAAATMRTRLNAFTAREIDLLLKAGYAGAAASLRVRGLGDSSLPASFDVLPLRCRLSHQVTPPAMIRG
jgi:branched-subunit amino acid ABC-type transport system permease component